MGGSKRRWHLHDFFILEEMGALLGDLHENTLHSHYALQLLFPLSESVTIRTPGSTLTGRTAPIPPLQIPSGTPHRVEGPLFILLINPLSSTGHYLSAHRLSPEAGPIDETWAPDLALLAKRYYKSEILPDEFRVGVARILTGPVRICKEEHPFSDRRIQQAIAYLEEHEEEIIPLEEIASVVSLSGSRFLHLFKDSTGMNYRRFQLWNRLLLFIRLYSQSGDMTRAALDAGFSDSAHLSKTFRESFGYSPTEILK